MGQNDPLIFRHARRGFSLITEAQFLRFVFKSSKWGLALVSRPQNDALKSGRAETLWANRQNVGKASPDIFSLPFIRNHDFARNSTKGFISKAFRAFPSRLHGRLKKETVNLSPKNAILCTRAFHVLSARAFSLTTETRFWRMRKPSLHVERGMILIKATPNGVSPFTYG